MKRSTYENIVLYLKELSEFILELKSIRTDGIPALLKKYEFSQFVTEFQTLRTSRLTYEQLLVASVAKKVELAKILSRAIIVEDTIIESIKEVVETKKKSKKSKK